VPAADAPSCRCYRTPHCDSYGFRGVPNRNYGLPVTVAQHWRGPQDSIWGTLATHLPRGLQTPLEFVSVKVAEVLQRAGPPPAFVVFLNQRRHISGGRSGPLLWWTVWSGCGREVDLRRHHRAPSPSAARPGGSTGGHWSASTNGTRSAPLVSNVKGSPRAAACSC
jgi:hypothetical protein